MNRWQPSIATFLALSTVALAASPTRVLKVSKGKIDTVTLAGSKETSLIEGRDTILGLGKPFFVASMDYVVGIQEKDSAIKALIQENGDMHRIQAAKVDTLRMVHRKLDSIQDSAYRTLANMQKRTDDLLTRSIANTDQAVALARSIRARSYVSTALIGAAAGLAIRRTWWAGLGGAALGAGLNFLVVRF